MTTVLGDKSCTIFAVQGNFDELPKYCESGLCESVLSSEGRQLVGSNP